MKRIYFLIFSFCSIFLSITVFLNYSDCIYNSVFFDKKCIIIENLQEQNMEEFSESLIYACKKCDADILYSTIENASAKTPAYKIYTTSVRPEFIKLLTNYSKHTISEDTYLTTDKLDKNTSCYVYGSTLYSHFQFYDFSEISELELSHSKFYVNSESFNRFSSYLISQGYEVVQVTDDNRMEQSESMTELLVMFIILTVFLFFSAVCYAFSKRRNIVIKKANGYSEFYVFKTTFLKDLLAMPTICLSMYITFSIVVEMVYKNSFIDFLKYGLKYVFIYILISCVLFIVACIYVQFKKSAGEIRGNNPSKSTYIIAVVFKIIVSIVIIWGFTCTNDSIIYRYNLGETQKEFSSVSENYAVLSLNSGSTDFYNNSDEYMNKCKNFILKLKEQHETVIVDSIEFLDNTENYEKTLYITPNYLNMNPVYDINGKLLNLNKIPEDCVNILVPDNYSGTTINQAVENEIDVNIIYYKSGQRFRTFNQYVGVEKRGFLLDPMVVIINDEILSWKAQSIIGEQFLLVKSDSENPYIDIKDEVSDCGLSNVILEAQKLSTIFDVAIMNANIKMCQYLIISILYLVVLVLVVFFETIVYYENNKRLLTIKKIYGYGFRAYKQMAVNKALISVIIFVCSVMMGFNIVFAVLATFIDLISFFYYIRKLEKNSIVQYLKGDM